MWIDCSCQRILFQGIPSLPLFRHTIRLLICDPLMHSAAAFNDGLQEVFLALAMLHHTLGSTRRNNIDWVQRHNPILLVEYLHWTQLFACRVFRT